MTALSGNVMFWPRVTLCTGQQSGRVTAAGAQARRNTNKSGG
jgi:hypothetical protein